MIACVHKEGNQFVIADGDGEFARTDNVELALSYVRDLLYGPGTARDTRFSFDDLAREAGMLDD